MWSLGCVLFELFTNQILFTTRAIPVILARMQSILGPIPTDMLEQGPFTKNYYRVALVSEARSTSTSTSSSSKRTSTSSSSTGNTPSNSKPSSRSTSRNSRVSHSRRSSNSGLPRDEANSNEDAVSTNSHMMSVPKKSLYFQLFQRCRFDIHTQTECDLPNLWRSLDSMSSAPEELENTPDCTESYLYPRKTSLLARILDTAREQYASAHPREFEAHGIPPELTLEHAMLTCHAKSWPGARVQARPLEEDTPETIRAFISARTCTAPARQTTNKIASSSTSTSTSSSRGRSKSSSPSPSVDVDEEAELKSHAAKFPNDPRLPRPSFFGKHHPNQLPPHESYALFANFLNQLLQYKPADRPTPEQALLHPFLWPMEDDEEWDL